MKKKVVEFITPRAKKLNEALRSKTRGGASGAHKSKKKQIDRKSKHKTNP